MVSHQKQQVKPLRVNSNATLRLTEEDGTLIKEVSAIQVIASSVEFSGSFGDTLFSAIFHGGAEDDGTYIFLTEGHNDTACRYLGDGFFYQLNAKIEVTVSNSSKTYDAIIIGFYFDENKKIHAHMTGHLDYSD